MKPWLRLVLVVTTVGGGFVATVAIIGVIQSRPKGLLAWLPIILFLALDVFVMASGLIFVQDPRKTRPLAVALGLQIPRISSYLLVYVFSTGLQLAFDVAAGATDSGGPAVRFKFAAHLGATMTFDILHQHPVSLGINLWAVAMLILLWRSARITAAVPQMTTSACAEPAIHQTPDN